jgi:CPA1 family monovalent cation:H+ antiporter
LAKLCVYFKWNHFLLIGLELPEIVNGICSKGIPLSIGIGYGVLVTVVLIVARMISGYAALFATMIFRPSVMPHASSRRRRFLMPALLGWTGMRGVVSLAAALAIPVTLDDGTAFPNRDLILFITFIAILLTLVVQGLTLPYFIKRSRLFDGIFEERDEEAEQKVKQGLREHTSKFLERKLQHQQDDLQELQVLLQHWMHKTQTKNNEVINEKTKKIHVELLQSQREYLNKLNEDPSISEEIIRIQQYQIDLEEERVKIL